MCIILPLTDICMKGCDFMYTRYVCSYCGKEFVGKATCRRHEMVEHGKYNEIAAGYLVNGKTRATFVTTHIMYMVANLIVNIKWIANTETAINTSTERT